MNKNITVLAASLATAIAFGALIESADAQSLRRRIRNTYSPTSSDASNVQSQFTLVDSTVDGTPIIDRSEDQDIGLFVGAIENFGPAVGSITDSRDSEGITGVETPIEFTSNPLSGNLLVERFKPGQDPLFKSSQALTIGYTIVEQGNNEPAYTFRLINYSSIPNFDENKAINSLSYIVEQNLLGRTEPVTFEDPNENFIYRYPRDLNTSRAFIEYTPNVPLINKEVSTPVPEPGTILGTLAALATGALIRRAKQH